MIPMIRAPSRPSRNPTMRPGTTPPATTPRHSVRGLIGYEVATTFYLYNAGINTLGAGSSHRTVAVRVDDGFQIAHRAERESQLWFHGHEAGEVLAEHLDPRTRPVMPDADLAEASTAQPVLRELDLSQQLDGNRSPVGDSGGEARVARLVPERQPEFPRDSAHISLLEAGIHQRMPEPRRVHRADPRSDIPQVGDIDSICDYREPALASDRGKFVREPLPAEETAISGVPPVLRRCQLARLNDAKGDPYLRRVRLRLLKFPPGKGLRVGKDRERPATDRVEDDSCDEPRVDPTGVRDEDAAL